MTSNPATNNTPTADTLTADTLTADTLTADTAPTRPTRLTGLKELSLTEARLTLREPAVALFVLALPVGLLLAFGLPTAGDPPDPSGGQQAAAAFIPGMATVLALGMLGLFQLPSVLAGYREKGVLKRLATTPAPPISLLLAQLLVNAALAVVGGCPEFRGTSVAAR